MEDVQEMKLTTGLSSYSEVTCYVGTLTFRLVRRARFRARFAELSRRIRRKERQACAPSYQVALKSTQNQRRRILPPTPSKGKTGFPRNRRHRIALLLGGQRWTL